MKPIKTPRRITPAARISQRVNNGKSGMALTIAAPSVRRPGVHGRQATLLRLLAVSTIDDTFDGFDLQRIDLDLTLERHEIDSLDLSEFLLSATSDFRLKRELTLDNLIERPINEYVGDLHQAAMQLTLRSFLGMADRAITRLI